ncbi:hypothetical protein Aperf_G00000101785 [Anoplocephala perfoliata]
MGIEANVFPDGENRSANLPTFQSDECAHTDSVSSKSVIVLPKYYPENHDLTKWLIHQMRRRIAPHHLVNFANLYPSILSAHFEVHDEPEKYISTKETCCRLLPAYSSKTVLFLTPLAMAVYFGCKTIIRVLLDDSGSYLQSRARSNVDINATCFGMRLKPKCSLFDYDDYFTTSASVLALRQEFYTGLSFLSAAGFKPHDRFQYITHIASPDQKIFWITDIIEYALRLIITRPGFDIAQLLHYLTYPSPDGKRAYDILTYDVYKYKDSESHSALWFSLFRRVCRRGISPAYTNCASRLIDVLEILEKMGFFKHDVMPRGSVDYSSNQGRNNVNRHQLSQKVSASDVRMLSSTEAAEAMRQIAIDRDECFAFMVIWLSQLRKSSLTKPYQRLCDILLSSLADTQMLEDFLIPPSQTNSKSIIWPHWVELGTELVQKLPNTNRSSNQDESNILNEDALDLYYLETFQVHELRRELKNIALVRGLISERVCEKSKETVKTTTLSNLQSPKPREMTVSPGNEQKMAQNPIVESENNLTCHEIRQCGDTVTTPSLIDQPNSQPVAFRRRNISSQALNQHPLEEKNCQKQHHQPRSIIRTNINNGMTLPRPKTSIPTLEKKMQGSQRFASEKKLSHQLTRRRNVTSQCREVTTSNGKNNLRPRWQI